MSYSRSLKIISAVLLIVATGIFFKMGVTKFIAIFDARNNLAAVIASGSSAYAQDEALDAEALEASHLYELQPGEYAVLVKEGDIPARKSVEVSRPLSNGSTYKVTVDKNSTVDIIEHVPGSHTYVSTVDPHITIGDEFAGIGGYDEDGVSKAVRKKLSVGRPVDVIVTLMLPFKQYYDKNDSPSARVSKKSQFDNASAKIKAVIAPAGGSVTHELPIISAVALHVNEEALKGLSHNPLVEKIDPDLTVRAFLDTSVDQIGGSYAWNLSDAAGGAILGTGIRVAVIDTGVDYRHPDLGGCLGLGCKVESGYDFVNNDADPMDDHGHGTHVAATVAGIGSAGTTRLNGVAPGAKIIAYKVLNSAGSGSFSAVIAAINRAVDPNNDSNPSDHVDIISMSLGASCGTYSTSCGPTDSVSTAVDKATAAGVVSAIAAGNSGPTASTVGSPGAAATAITVAAGCKPSQTGTGYCVTQSGSTVSSPVAYFSSRGPVIYNTTDYKKPDITAPGVLICAARHGTYSSSPCFDSTHIRISGTSMATPHIAGVLALLKQAYPNYIPADLKNLIKSTATDLGLVYDTQGVGMVDVQKALPVVSQFDSSPKTFSITTDPTNKISTAAQSFTITPKSSTLGALTINFVAPVAGVTFTSSKTSINMAGGASDTFTGTITVDNDVVSAGSYATSIIFKDGTGKSVGAIPVFINVLPSIEVSPAQTIDYGIENPNLPSWTSMVIPITVRNRRTDKEQSVSIGASQFKTGIAFNSDKLSASIPAGGSAVFNTSLSVSDSSVVPNGSYTGLVTVTSPMSTWRQNATFTKYYTLTIQDESGPYKSRKISIKTLRPNSSLIISGTISNTIDLYRVFYSKPVEAFVTTWYDDYPNPNRFVFLPSVAVNGVTTVTSKRELAVHRITFDYTDINSNRLNLGTIPRVAMRSVHNGKVSDNFNISAYSVSPSFFVNPLSDEYAADFSYYRIETDPVNYLINLKSSWGVSSDQTITVRPADYQKVTIQSDINRSSGTASPALWYCYETSCSAIIAATQLPYPITLYAPKNDDAILFAKLTNDAGRYGCPTSGACNYVFESPAISPARNTIEPYKSQWMDMIYNEPRAPYPEPVGNIVYHGLGPTVWFAKFQNTQTSVNLVMNYGKGAIDTSNMPCFISAFVRQGYAIPESNATPYSIYKGGTLVTSGNLPRVSNAIGSCSGSASYSNLITSKSLASGAYSFKTSTPYQNQGVNLIGTVDTSFDTAKADPNPPFIKLLHYSTDGTRTDVYYSKGSTNTLQLALDPNGGLLTSVVAEYSLDGTTSVPLNVSSSGTPAGEGYTAAIPDGLTVSTNIITIRFTATDNSGNVLQYTFQLPISSADPPTGGDQPPQDTTQPTTAITNPVDGSVVSGTVNVTASASDDVNVTKVELWKNGTLFGTDTSSPYAFSWDTILDTNSLYTLLTKAYDAAGNVGSSSPVSVTVNNTPQPDTTAPNVSITSPLAGATVSGIMTVAASASDNVGVTKVELWKDAVLFGTDTAAAYSFTWDTTKDPNSSYALQSKAYDAAGNIGTSAVIGVSVNNVAEPPQDVTPPVVTITSPLSGATVSRRSKVDITANATDNITVTKVEFMVDSSIKCTDSIVPYICTWSVPNRRNSTYIISAKAYDQVGNASTSPSITVTSQ